MTGTYASNDPLGQLFAAGFRAMKEGGGHRHGRCGPGHRARRSEFPFGGGFPQGGPPFGRGRKARRGDVRAAALVLLDEEPRNGYQLMQEIEQRSDGAWRPSPGSVYPALAQLEDEGLVRTTETDGRKAYELTGTRAARTSRRTATSSAPPGRRSATT